MALRKYTLYIVLSLNTLSASSGVCSDYELTLPDGRSMHADLKLKESEGLRLYYQNDLLDGPEGDTWAYSLKRALINSYSLYKALSGTRELQNCVSPSATMPPLSFVFLDEFPTDAKSHDRVGYDHPSNPGLLIQSSFWRESSVRYLLAHEAVHRWCDHKSGRTPIDHWKEEGAADYVAAKSTGAWEPAQANVSTYFIDPCQSGLYGGSYLWWMARMESPETQADFLSMLASLHLGLRPDLVYGQTKTKDPAKKSTKKLECLRKTAEIPLGYIETKSQAKAKPTNSNRFTPISIPFWTTPWGERMLSAPENLANRSTLSYFVWIGPIAPIIK